METNRISSFLVVLCFLTLGGCINLLPKEEPYEQITLEFEKDPDSLAPVVPVNWQLSIEVPATAGFYNSDKIVVLVNDYDYTYAVGVRWIDKLASLLQSKVIRAFEDADKIRSVSAPSSGINPTYILMLVVRKFQIEVDIPKKPVVVVSLGAKLLELRSRKIIDYKLFTSKATMESNGLYDTTTAFNDAYSNVMNQIIPWVLDR